MLTDQEALLPVCPVVVVRIVIVAAIKADRERPNEPAAGEEETSISKAAVEKERTPDEGPVRNERRTRRTRVYNGYRTPESDTAAHHSTTVEAAHGRAAHTSVKATATMKPTTSAAESTSLSRNRKSHRDEA
jgi:hypothetical protein